MKKYLLAPAFVLGLAFTGLAGTAAHADCSSGFLANLACESGIIDEDTANQLDDAHEEMGRPLDHLGNEAAGAAADYFVPGSGEFVTEGLEMRDAIRRGEVHDDPNDDQ